MLAPPNWAMRVFLGSLDDSWGHSTPWSGVSGSEASIATFLHLGFFQEDCDLENVWLMGGLSILTSVPVTTHVVCLLCASKGFHQVCLTSGAGGLITGLGHSG